MLEVYVYNKKIPYVNWQMIDSPLQLLIQCLRWRFRYYTLAVDYVSFACTS